MLIISLRNFVLTGQFGPVKIGMSKDEVIHYLGEPDFDADFRHGSRALTYACYEFFYYEGENKINSIQNDRLTAYNSNYKDHLESIYFKNDKFVLDLWFLQPGHDVTYKEVIAILKDEKISFQEILKDQEGGPIIQFESGVRMDFDDLSGIWRWDENGKFEEYDGIISNQDDELLNGIRFFPDWHVKV